jgi:hypothetical protein
MWLQSLHVQSGDSIKNRDRFETVVLVVEHVLERIVDEEVVRSK